MTKAIRIPVVCFEITQQPAQKTDYFFSVRGETFYGNGAQSAQIEAWLWQIHSVLASPVLPDDEAVIGCPTPFGEEKNALLCLCRARRVVPQGGGRDFLHFQAIFVSIQDLIQADINSLSLYYSDIWSENSGNHSIATCTPPPQGRAGTNIDDLAHRLIGNQPSSKVPVASVASAVAQVHQALGKIAWHQLAQASFAIGIPDNCQLPGRPMLTVQVTPPKPQTVSHYRDIQNTQSVQDHRNQKSKRHLQAEAATASVSAYKAYVAEIADDVSLLSGISPFWATRLWNHSQDVLAQIEAVERSGSLTRHQKKLFAAHATLISELERSKVDGRQQASPELQRLWKGMNRVRSSRWTWWELAPIALASLAVFIALIWALFIPFLRQGGEAYNSQRSANPALFRSSR